MHPSRECLEREIDGLQKDLKDRGILVVQGDAAYENIAHRLDDFQFEQQRQLSAHQDGAERGLRRRGGHHRTADPLMA